MPAGRAKSKRVENSPGCLLGGTVPAAAVEHQGLLGTWLSGPPPAKPPAWVEVAEPGAQLPSVGPC